MVQAPIGIKVNVVDTDRVVGFVLRPEILSLPHKVRYRRTGKSFAIDAFREMPHHPSITAVVSGACECGETFIHHMDRNEVPGEKLGCRVQCPCGNDQSFSFVRAPNFDQLDELTVPIHERYRIKNLSKIPDRTENTDEAVKDFLNDAFLLVL